MTDEDIVSGLLDYSKSLIGGHIERDGITIRITEVEAYAGPLDPASHAFKRTPRCETMFGPAGHAYCYFTYGMHWCINIVWGPPEVATGVLLRAGEVMAGQELARERRGPKTIDRNLARGPACLAKCLAIGREEIGLDVINGDDIHVSPRELPLNGILAGPRVGVSKAADRPWRFWLDGDRTVSAYKRSPRAPALPA